MPLSKIIFAFFTCAFLTAALLAQQATVGTPMHSVGDSFFEYSGLSWQLRWPGGFFRFGNPNLAVPPFGGFDPGAGIHGGWSFGNRNFGGQVFFNYAQGSQRSYVSQTPMLTLTSGYPGYFADTSQSPFVIGYVPVVGGSSTLGSLVPMLPPPAGRGSVSSGGFSGNERVQAMKQILQQRGRQKEGEPREAVPAEALLPRRPAQTPEGQEKGGSPIFSERKSRQSPANPLPAAQASSAGRPAPSVAEARRLHALEQDAQNQEALVLMERGRNAEADGKPGVARIYYQMAARRTEGKLKQEVLQCLQRLKAESK